MNIITGSLPYRSGEAILLQPPLETGDVRPMGASDSRIRIPVGIHQFPASVTVSDHYTSQGHRQEIGAHRGDQATSPKNAIEKVHPQQVCFLSSCFPHHEEIGRMETHPQPTASKQGHKAPSVQDGIPGSGTPRAQERRWGATLDFRDAYLHIAIDPSDKKWLGFCINEHTYRFKSLPFGLSTAPRTFTRIVKVVRGTSEEREFRCSYT